MTYARAMQLLVIVLGTCFTVYHLYVAFVGVPEPLIFRGTHLMWMLVLAFLVYTSFKGHKDQPPGIVDWLFVVASALSIGYIFYEYEYFTTRFATVDDLRLADWVFGTTLIVCILESARRVLGAAMSLTAIAFLLYALLFTSLQPQMMLDQLYMTTDGILGIPISVCAT
jgi:TRAP-type uncharacterized transport system fused permease subunit